MPVKKIVIDVESADQRIDNFLLLHFKGVPRSRLYRALRKGEIRVNKKRVKALYRLKSGDEVRMPPLHVPEKEDKTLPKHWMDLLAPRILLEKDSYLVIDKPSGMPVHGGTGIDGGVIDVLRALRPEAKFLELVHRLDRDTSGCLLIAKKRARLVQFHKLLTGHEIQKQYFALVQGHWPEIKKRVELPLLKNTLQSGERVVRVDFENGKPAITLFKPLKYFKHATLVMAYPLTGRTHQIRVHAQAMGHPIAGDEKYGNDHFNKNMRILGCKRLFLHSAGLSCRLSDDELLGICVGLDDRLGAVLARLEGE